MTGIVLMGPIRSTLFIANTVSILVVYDINWSHRHSSLIILLNMNSLNMISLSSSGSIISTFYCLLSITTKCRSHRTNLMTTDGLSTAGICIYKYLSLRIPDWNDRTILDKPYSLIDYNKVALYRQQILMVIHMYNEVWNENIYFNLITVSNKFLS